MNADNWLLSCNTVNSRKTEQDIVNAKQLTLWFGGSIAPLMIECYA